MEAKEIGAKAEKEGEAKIGNGEKQKRRLIRVKA